MGLEYGDYGDMLLKDDQYLLETKIPGVTPLWFARILSEGGIIPASFSKYGMIYRQSLNKNALLEASNNMIQTENRGIVLC